MNLNIRPNVFAPVGQPQPAAAFDPETLVALHHELSNRPPAAEISVQTLEAADLAVADHAAPPRGHADIKPLVFGFAAACVSLLALGLWGGPNIERLTAFAGLSKTAAPEAEAPPAEVSDQEPAEIPYLGAALVEEPTAPSAPAPAPLAAASAAARAVPRAVVSRAVARTPERLQAPAPQPVLTAPGAENLEPPPTLTPASSPIRAPAAADAAAASPSGAVLIRAQSEQELLGPRAQRRDELAEGALASLASDAPQRMASAIAGF